jgi:hypothetical protein
MMNPSGGHSKLSENACCADFLAAFETRDMATRPATRRKAKEYIGFCAFCQPGAGCQPEIAAALARKRGT